MSGGGGSQTSTSVQQADPRIWDAVNQNMQRATGIADQPFQAYGGQMVAPLSPGYNEAIARAPGINGAGYEQLQQAQGGAQGLLSYQPQSGAAGMAAYQNPWESQVVQGTLSDIERQRQMQQGSDADAAIAARAFGGSREGVQRSLTNEAFDRNAFNAVSGLRSQGFNNAAGYAQQDANRDLQGAGVRSNASGLLGQLGQAQQQMAMNGQNALLQTGGLQQGNQQQSLDAMFQEFMRQQQHPYQGQSLINQSLGLLPQGGTTTSTQPGPDRTGQLLGALGSAASLFAMSDERCKADIETVAYDTKGRRWATWRYNWEDPRIRHFGLIAQETLKTDPDAVLMGADGFYRIDYSKLTRH
jgi:hypothetical protein